MISALSVALQGLVPALLALECALQGLPPTTQVQPPVPPGSGRPNISVPIPLPLPTLWCDLAVRERGDAVSASALALLRAVAHATDVDSVQAAATIGPTPAMREEDDWLLML
jgi:hypothetical protein